MASAVVARPAAAATALISRIPRLSSVAPNAETTWYSPSVRFPVLCPTVTAMFCKAGPHSATRLCASLLNDAMLAIPALKSVAIATAATPTPASGSDNPAVSPAPTLVIFDPNASSDDPAPVIACSKLLVSPTNATTNSANVVNSCSHPHLRAAPH